MRDRPPAAPRLLPRLSLAAFVAAVVALALVPGFVKSPYALHVLILLFLAVIQGEAWNVLGGYTGQYSVGHAAYFGIGAYTTLLLLQVRGVPPWIGVFPAIALALAVALVVGSITFRLRGPYFVLASIAVAEIMRLGALNWKGLTNGAEGVNLNEIPAFKLFGRVLLDAPNMTPVELKVPFYYAGLALVVLAIAANFGVQHSKLGYCFQAIREDQDAAHSLGIPLARYKNYALLISAGFTAWAGAYYGLYVGYIEPGSVLAIDVSVAMVLIAIIGGIGTILGPVIGALVLVPLQEALRANLLTDLLVGAGIVSADSSLGLFLKQNLAQAHVLIYGVLVVIVILFMPDGVVGFVRQLGRRRAARQAASVA